MRIGTLLYRQVKSFHWNITPIILAILFISPIKLLSQAGNIDQIRNGPANDPSKNFWDNFDNPMHVNGNAGASNAHYVEGHSISYRSLITGVAVGSQYQYVIEYDTKHSGRMAIDYLTHYQRLEPHQQFNHPAEVINPLILETGSNEYIFNVKSTNTFPIPAPFQAPANTPVAGMPQNSFNALTDGEKLFTIYNGLISNIEYVTQQSLTTSATESKTSVKITFTADDDSVLLAWGGHIASRGDWGFLNPTTPRSAGGISGSPYHMRQISMNTFPGLVNIPIGNQDRSLSAAAVIAPPVCSISPHQFACPETASLTFNYTGGTTGATFLWSINAGNTAGAQISGSATGSSVTIVPIGADFVPGGTFNLTLAVTANGLTTTCSLSPAGTIHDVQVSATADPTSINLAVSNTSQLLATITSGPAGGTYAFSWAQNPASGGSLSATNIANPVFTATEAGTYRFIVTATLQGTLNCVAKDTVFIPVTSANPPCGISGPNPVCPKSTNTYKYDPNLDGTAESIPANFTAKWTLPAADNTNGATLGAVDNANTVQVTAGVLCKTSFRLVLTLTSTSGLIIVSCDTTITVDVNSELTITCPSDKDLACGASTDPAGSAGTATAPNNGCGVLLMYIDTIYRTWVAIDACGDKKTCRQILRIDTCIVSNSIPGARQSTNETITSGPVLLTSPVSNQSLKPTVKNRPVIDPKTTSSAALTKELQVQAYPNPFSNTVNFRFVSPVSGRAILEVFNTQGQRVGIAFDGLVGAGIAKSVQFSTRLTNQALIYKLKVGDKTVRGTVLELKR